MKPQFPGKDLQDLFTADGVSLFVEHRPKGTNAHPFTGNGHDAAADTTFTRQSDLNCLFARIIIHAAEHHECRHNPYNGGID